MAFSSSIFSGDNVLFLLAGTCTMTVIVAPTILIALFFGMILGLVRNYDHGILGELPAVYIETFRNTPLILWILAIRFLIPILAFYSGIPSISIFTTAIMTEVVRGGLNPISKGQFEAAYLQGFGFSQTLRFIIIPQCSKNIVPSLPSQMITTVKDTSLLWAVAIEEFTGKGMILMGRFASSIQAFILFVFTAGIYFIISLMLSSIVRRQNIEGQSLKKPVLVEA